MQRWLGLVALAVAGLLRGAEAPIERDVAALVAGPQVTVIHFWAPWCPNCRVELDPDHGWAKVIGANPAVKFVFISFWHNGQDGAALLAAAKLGPQANLLLLTHPNPSRRAADRATAFLGLPVTWLPTTWIFRDGQLRTAFNYGEIRFPVLQQMIDDARDEWDR